MEILNQLCVALGFATLAGINLYLVVLVTGLAIRYQWVILDTPYEQLAVLGEPTVVIAAGVFFTLEFFSDKIPWVDSLWDTVHTLIRPVGGGILAIQTLGQAEPAFIVITAMLAAGTTTITHGFKAGTRLAVNASPEPFSNIGVSLSEDVAVMGGLALMAIDPRIAAIVFLIFLGFVIYLTPKLFRRSKSFLWLLGQRLGFRAAENSLSAEEQLSLGPGEVMWSQRLATGKVIGFGIPTDQIGIVTARASESGELSLLGQRFWRTKKWLLQMDSALDILHEPKIFSENVVIFDKESGRHLVLRLPKGQRGLAIRVIEELRAMKVPSPQKTAIEASIES